MRLVLWLLGTAGCSQPPLPPVPASSVAGAPHPSAKDESRPAAPPCDPQQFACDAAERCKGVDRRDDALSLVEFLCIAHGTSRVQPASLQSILAATPTSFRKNFTAKHGLAHPGERGHAFEELDAFVPAEVVASGQSASPTSPRTLIWDEGTGFTISFNGGAEGQSGGGRLDLMSYDSEQEAFELWALELPVVAPVRPQQPHTDVDDCAHCHGPRSRPIWPMYPDWPGFFGSDNDELTSSSPAATLERGLWTSFRDCVAAPREGAACDGVESATEGPAADSRGRFSGLFAPVLEAELREAWPSIGASEVAAYVREHPGNLPAETTADIFTDPEATGDWLGLWRHPSFPFRPDHGHKSGAPSRAFFHRPNLRLGVLYNRLLAGSLMASLRGDPVFVEHQRFVALAVMDCGWDGDLATKAQVQARFGNAVAERLDPLGLSIGPDTDVRQPLLLAALGSSVREVDMRFSHSNPAYEPLDATGDAPLAPGPMDLGFIAYGERDLHAVGASSRYFNSYFDGTATFDELWVARMLEALVPHDPELAAVYVPNTLTQKYLRFIPRMALDKTFFAQMDALGGWMPLPYPRHLRPIHDREPFYKRKGGRRRFIEPYLAVCRELRRGLAEDVDGA